MRRWNFRVLHALGLLNHLVHWHLSINLGRSMTSAYRWNWILPYRLLNIEVIGAVVSGLDLALVLLGDLVGILTVVMALRWRPTLLDYPKSKLGFLHGGHLVWVQVNDPSGAFYLGLLSHLRVVLVLKLGAVD